MANKPTHIYSLVKFDDQSLCVLSSKRVNLLNNNGCIVKYLGGAKYSAELIESSGNITLRALFNYYNKIINLIIIILSSVFRQDN